MSHSFYCCSSFLKRFEDAFRYTEDGLPRVWQQGENMDDIFIKSRDLAEELVTLLSKMPIPDDTNDSAIINDPVCSFLNLLLTLNI